MSFTTSRLSKFPDDHLGTNIEGAQPIPKADMYGWQPVPSPVYALKKISKYELWIDHEYQRANISSSNINKIAGNWLWECVSCIVCSLRPTGEFVVIEGQHRVRAAMKRAEIDELPCIVLQFASQKEEAQAFLNINTVRKAVSATDKHSAGFVAEDERAIAAQHVYSEMGIRLIKNPSAFNETKMISETTADVARYGPDMVKSALSIMLGMNSPSGIKRDIYAPLIQLIKRNPDKLGIIRSRLVASGPEVCLHKIKQTRILTGQGGYIPGMKALADIINKGLRTNKVIIGLER